MTGGSAAARDPGLEYLYKHPQHSKFQHSSTAESMLVMNPLPRSIPQLDEQGPGRDWAGAMGNMETAKLAMETLRGLMVDAVFLDEDAYTNAATLQLYQQRLQVVTKLLSSTPLRVFAACLSLAQQRRILQLEGEVEALRVEAGRQQESLTQQRAQTRAAEARIQELQQELDNNAVVFDMHYQELLLKNEEIQRLKTVIEGMGSTG
eukprot:gene7625-7827_t